MHIRSLRSGKYRLFAAFALALAFALGCGGGGGGDSTPAPAVVTVAPAFTTQPADQISQAGANATFVAIATGVPTPTYQWEYSADGTTWSAVTNGTDSRLTITVQDSYDQFLFRAKASNSLGTVTSKSALLTVTSSPNPVAPVFTAQPTDQSVQAGTSVTFTSLASGTPTPSYQWERSADGAIWTSVTGETHASLSFMAQAADNGAKFRVKATNSVSTATSNTVTLTVTSSGGSTAPAFTMQPVNQSVQAGTSVTFTSLASGTPTPSYQWERSADGATWMSVNGETHANLSFTAQAADNGAKFRVKATNSVSTATSNTVTLTVTSSGGSTAPAFTTQPVNQSVQAGTSVTFTSLASGKPTPSYQWERSADGATWTSVNGETHASLSFTAQAADNGAKFRVKATNSVGNAVSNAATLTVQAQPSGPVAIHYTQDAQDVWAAYQEEDGPWTALTANSGFYTFTLSDASHRYGFAKARSYGASLPGTVSITLSTGSEWLERQSDPWPTKTAVQVLGSLSGLGATEKADVIVGHSSTTVDASTCKSFAFWPGAPDTLDYLVGKYDPAVSPLYNRIYIQRGIDLKAPGPLTLPNVDLSTQGFVPGVAHLTVNGSTNAETVEGWAGFSTKNGGMSLNDPVSNHQTGGAPTVFDYSTIPAQYLDPTDSFLFVVSALTGQDQFPAYERTIGVMNSPSCISRSMDLPAQLTAAYATVAATSPYVRMQGHWPTDLGYTWFVINYDQSSHWNVTLYPGWLRGASAYTLPDFSPVPGWQSVWGLVTGTPMQYSIMGSGGEVISNVVTVRNATKKDKLNP